MVKVIQTRVGPDGMLRFSMPVGQEFANHHVAVVVDVQKNAPPVDEMAWRQFIADTAGKWKGEFELPSLGPPETREGFQ